MRHYLLMLIGKGRTILSRVAKKQIAGL